MKKDETGWVTGPIQGQQQPKLKRQPTGSYAIGYAQAPKDTQWKPGQSGNPRGRPKKPERSVSQRQQLRDIAEIMEEHVPIAINGQRKTMTMFQAAVRRIMLQAMEGKLAQQKIFLQLSSAVIEGNAKLNPTMHQMLEAIEEQIALTDGYDDLPPEQKQELNGLRRQTRKI